MRKKLGDGWDVWKKEVEVLHRLASAAESPDEQELAQWAAEIRAVVARNSDAADANIKGKSVKISKSNKRKRRVEVIDEEEDSFT